MEKIKKIIKNHSLTLSITFVIIVVILLFSCTPFTVCEEECVKGITQEECHNSSIIEYPGTNFIPYVDAPPKYIGTLKLRFRCTTMSSTSHREIETPNYTYYEFNITDMNNCCHKEKAFGLIKKYNLW